MTTEPASKPKSKRRRSIVPLTAADFILGPPLPPAVLDLVLAERLRLDAPRDVRDLIRCHRHSLELLGGPLRRAEPAIAGRPAGGYLLNRQQALMLAIVAKAPVAARRGLAAAFDTQGGSGELAAAGPETPVTGSQVVGLLSRVERALNRLNANGEAARSAINSARPETPVARNRKQRTETNDVLWGLEAIANHVTMNIGTVRRLVRNGELPVHRSSGSYWISRRKIDLWIETPPQLFQRLAETEDDPIGEFIATQLVESPGRLTPARRLYRSYALFAAERAVVVAPETRFCLRLRAEFGPSVPTHIEGKNYRGYPVQLASSALPNSCPV